MRSSRVFAIIAGFILLSVHADGRSQISQSEHLDRKARELAQRILILDSHIDLPYRLWEHDDDISRQTERGHFDYPRAIEGGLNALFAAIYIPAEYQHKGGAKILTDQLIDLIYDLQKKWPDKFQVVSSPDKLRNISVPGKINLCLGIENGSAIEDQLDNLEHFYDRGVRYITLVHSESNLICDASFDSQRPLQGLSLFGKKVIQEMNRLGMMIDVSHASDQAFYQILEISSAPVIASHSACRHFTPGFERNMDDSMIQKLAQTSGIIQIPFGSYFIKQDVNQAGETTRAVLDKFVKEKQLGYDDTLTIVFRDSVKAEFSVDPGEVALVVDHIEHVIKLAGIDYVGLGSDFEGVSMLPRNLQDVSHYPNLILELLKRGYSEDDIRKICGENFLRVWSEIDKKSEKFSH